MIPKILAFDNPCSEGVTITFDEKVNLNGCMSTNDWWMSWDKLKEFFNSQILHTPI